MVVGKWVRDYATADNLRDQLRRYGIEPGSAGAKSAKHPEAAELLSGFDTKHSGWESKDKLPPNIDPSKGDWHCTCGNWNWARRVNCNKCGSKKPEH